VIVEKMKSESSVLKYKIKYCGREFKKEKERE
jgi:hypothetical protein